MRNRKKVTLVGTSSLAIICLGLAGWISDGEVNQGLFVSLVIFALPFSALAFVIVGNEWDDYLQTIPAHLGLVVLNVLLLAAGFFIVHSVAVTLTGSTNVGPLFGTIWLIGFAFGIVVFKIT